MGLASKLNVDSIKVWARYELDGADIFAKTIGSKQGQHIKKGWNEVQVVPVPMTGKPFYVGYTIYQRGACYAISAVPPQHDRGLVVNLDGGWADSSAVSRAGLSIGAIVTANGMPAFDLGIDSIALPKGVQVNTAVPLHVAVTNYGSKTVSAFNLWTKEKGYDAVCHPVSQTVNPGAMANLAIDYTTPHANKERDVTLKIWLADYKEGTDENTLNDSCSISYDVTKYRFVKVPLLEEFTTEMCSNCPSAAEAIHEALSVGNYANEIAAVCHHAGYYEDKFTQQCDRNMLWLYGNQTYAPALMWDRTCYSYSNTPVCDAPRNKAELIEIFNYLKAMKTNVAILPKAVYNAATKQLNVTVTGGRDHVFGGDDIRLTVYLVENEIHSSTQNNGGNDYVQRHVIRAYNSTWGEPIQWEANDDFHYECDLTFPDSCVRSNMQIIAVVAGYNPTDATKCQVENAAILSDIDWNGTTAVSALGTSTDYRHNRAEVYDLTGRKLGSADKIKASLKKGIYIIGGRKVVVGR